jgi:putative oxidoreductase
MTARSENRMLDVGLLMIRLVLAAVFIYHGGQKLFGWFGGPGLEATAGGFGKMGIPLPMLSAVLASAAEFFGAIVLLIGTGTRIAAIPMAFDMLVAVLLVHRAHFDARSGGMEYPLTLGVVLAALILTGPGRLTLGHALSRASAAGEDGPRHRPVTA